MIDAEAGGKLLLIAPPPSDAGAEAARAGIENLARTLSVEWARYGIRTAALLPGEATDAGGGRRAGGVPGLAGRRLLLRLPLRPGVGVSERYRVTSLDSIEALPGPGSLRWLPVRYELGIGAFGTNAYVAAAAGDDVVEPHTEEAIGARGAVLRRARLGDVHARRRGGQGARGHVRLPPRSGGPPPRRRRRGRDDGDVVRRAARGGVHRLGLGGALPRHGDPRARPRSRRRRCTRRGWRAIPGASGRTTTSPAGMRSTAAPTRRARCSSGRSSSGATRSASRPRRTRTS